MNADPRTDRWRRYLEAELSGRDVDAEIELAELFTSLPRLRPAGGFADRVVARALGAAARRSLFARRGARWSLAAALLVAALSAGLVGPMLPALSRLVGPGELLAGLVALVSNGAVRFASGVALWQPVAETVATLARAMANPTVLTLLTLHLLLAALALRGLAALAAQGSTRHVVS